MKAIFLAVLLVASTTATMSTSAHVRGTPAAVEKSLNRDFDARQKITYFSHKLNPHFMANNTAHLFFTKSETTGRYGPLTLSLSLFSNEWHAVEGAYLEYGGDKVALPVTTWKMLRSPKGTLERTTIPLSHPKHLAIVQEMLGADKPHVGFLGSSRNALREVPVQSLVQMREVLAAYELLAGKKKHSR